MICARTSSVEQTRALAARLAELARPGDLLVLAGDLGAGKTAFTQGYGKGLGIDDQITSPTFTLHREYFGRLELHHLDVYRFEQMDEVLDVGLPELLDRGGVTVIEWGNAIHTELPGDRLEIRLMLGEGDDDRVIEFHTHGSRWMARERAMTTAFGEWIDDDETGGDR